MDFLLNNGLLVLAQEIAQEQKDLYELEKIKHKSNDMPGNEVIRRDYSDLPDKEHQDAADHARHQADEKNTMHCDEDGKCWDDPYRLAS